MIDPLSASRSSIKTRQATELLDSCLAWHGGPELLIQHSVWRNYLGLLIICLSPTLFSPQMVFPVLGIQHGGLGLTLMC